jgi:serine/threonine protein kinase
LKDLVTIKNSAKSILGRGAYGEVQLVQHARSKILYALKIIKKDNLNYQTPVEIFLREISIHKSVIHPNITRLYDHLEDKQKFYLILEYVEKGSLYNLIKKKIKLSELEACEIFKQACVGVSFLHDNKIIHRDIKSENFLISKDDIVKLCDFGWCAIGIQPRATFCGTADYMAPEMTSSESYNHKVDVWALGILLYELVHGRPPFLTVNIFDKLQEIESGNLQIRPGVSESLASLIRMILNKNPEERPEIRDILKHHWFSERISCKFRVGNAVKHPEFGDGTVVDTQGMMCILEFGNKTVEMIDVEIQRICESKANRSSVTRSQEFRNRPPLAKAVDKSPKITINKVNSQKEFLKKSPLPKRGSVLNTSVESLLSPATRAKKKRGTLFDFSFDGVCDISSLSPVKERRRSPLA